MSLKSRLNDLLEHTSRISNVGMCGRKSLPTKKHMNTKSSITRSKFMSKGASCILRSFSKYSRRVQMLRNCHQQRATIIVINKTTKI